LPYYELAEKLLVLNDNLLFDNPMQAEEFKKYYKSKKWSETEDQKGEFCIIQIDEITIK